MKKKSNQGNPLMAALAVSVMGFQVGICIFLGYLGGEFIAERTNMTGWIVAGVLVGLAVGLLSAVLVIKRILGGSNG